jgi:predicted permease
MLRYCADGRQLAWVVIGLLWILYGFFFERFRKKSTRQRSPNWRWFYLIAGAAFTARGIYGLVASGRR